MPSYNATGTINVSGCFNPAIGSYFVDYRFAEGSVVYRVDVAKKGRMERISIKRLRFIEEFGQYLYMYVDTLNALYSETDLCTHDEALAFAIAYYQQLIYDLDTEINRLTC